MLRRPLLPDQQSYNYTPLYRTNCSLTLSQTTNLRLFQTERVSRHNSKYYEYGRKFSKRVENAVGKGEIAR